WGQAPRRLRARPPFFRSFRGFICLCEPPRGIPMSLPCFPTSRTWLLLVLACTGLPFYWLPAAEPEGTGPVQFTELLIQDKYGYAYGIAAADLDGDGHLDLVSADTTNNTLSWFQNDGRGNFRRHFIMKDEAGWFERLAIGDLNRDGHLDVVVV